MRKIKDIISKPSQAIRAMVEGLKAQSLRKDFVIEMGTFGSLQDQLCAGCAATCAIQQIAGKNFTDWRIEKVLSRANFLYFEMGDLDYFEAIIDFIRQAEGLECLFHYFGIDTYSLGEYEYKAIGRAFNNLPVMTTYQESQCAEYESFASLLESFGY